MVMDGYALDKSSQVLGEIHGIDGHYEVNFIITSV